MVPILRKESGWPAEESNVLQAGRAVIPAQATPLGAGQCPQASAELCGQVVSVGCSVPGWSQEQASWAQMVHWPALQEAVASPQPPVGANALRSIASGRGSAPVPPD